MKSHGTEPSVRPLRRNLYWLALGAALSLGGAVAVSACIPAGSCDDGCEDGAGGSSGGSGGNNSGGGSGSGNEDPVLMAAVENCEAFPTVGEVETNLIKPKCGTGSGCHGTSGAKFPPELSSPKMYDRLFDKNVELACPDDKLIDPQEVDKSLLSVKQQDEPKCKDGMKAGERMPFNKDPLEPSEVTCIEEYVKAVVAAKAN